MENGRTLSSGCFGLLDSGRSTSYCRFIECGGTDSDDFESVLGRGFHFEDSITGIDRSCECISTRFKGDDIGNLPVVSFLSGYTYTQD